MAIEMQDSRPTFDYRPLTQEFLRDPYPVLAQARAEQPVFFYPEMSFWVVTRYEDLVQVVRDHEAFSQSAARLMPVPGQLRHRITEDWFDEAFLNADPPVHTVDRRIVNSAFTRTRIRAMEPQIEAIAERLIDTFAGDGHCDLMAQYTYPMGATTLATFVGLPIQDMQRLKAWAQDLLMLVHPRTTAVDASGTVAGKHMSEEELLDRWTRMADCRDYLMDLLDQREAEPTDDLISVLVGARDADGERVLSRGRIVTHLIDLIAAGTDTVAPLIAHTLLYLLERPDQLEAVRADPSLIDNAIEEGLRMRGTASHLFRYTTRDVELGGVTIPKESVVALSFASAGYDESHFDCPFQFDLHRENAGDHLAFGRGRHFCVGAPLARAEARISLTRLLQRIPDLRRVAEQELSYHAAIGVFMLERLELEWAAPAPDRSRTTA
jgi:cytochrome P450